MEIRPFVDPIKVQCYIPTGKRQQVFFILKRDLPGKHSTCKRYFSPLSALTNSCLAPSWGNIAGSHQAVRNIHKRRSENMAQPRAVGSVLSEFYAASHFARAVMIPCHKQTTPLRLLCRDLSGYAGQRPVKKPAPAMKRLQVASIEFSGTCNTYANYDKYQ